MLCIRLRDLVRTYSWTHAYKRTLLRAPFRVIDACLERACAFGTRIRAFETNILVC